MIDEVRTAVTGEGYRRALAVALHSMVLHNPTFCRSVVVYCPAAEVDATERALDGIPALRVVAHEVDVQREVEALSLDSGWLVDRFRSIELLGVEHRTGGDVLFVDADILVTGPLDALDVPGDVVACGEGARHLGLHVDRTTNALVRPGELADPIVRTFNSGVMKLDGALLGAPLLDRAFNVMRATDWQRLQRRQHDQFVVNRLFEDRWTEVSPRHNFLLRHAAAIWAASGVSVTEARLLHFNVDPRPWSSAPIPGDVDRQLGVALAMWRAAETERQARDDSARNHSPTEDR